MGITKQRAQRLTRIKQRALKRWKCPACKGIRRVKRERADEIPTELQGWHWCICGETTAYHDHVAAWRTWVFEKIDEGMR